jgi:acyl-CoA synthetase (AMP-forming)/AMP-acid ligase II
MPSQHIPDLVRRNASANGQKLALVTSERQLSWAELADEMEKAAAGLFKLVKSDEPQVIGLLMPNTWQFVVSYLAILELGHTALPIDVIYKPLEINAILDQIKPVLLVTDEAGEARIDNWPNLVTFDGLPAGDDYSKVRLAADKQLATIIFTSGTTGKPKAATHTHSSHFWNIEVCSQAWGWTDEDTLLISLRLSHWYGICMGLSGAIYHSNTLYLLERFSAEETLKFLSSGKISLFTHTPIAYQKMLEQEGDYDLSHLRLAISGSAPLPPANWAAFKERFGVEIIECYGSSETGRIASNRADDKMPGSPGRPLPDVEIKLSNSNELLVRSPGLFPGYFNNPEATAEKMHDGFWSTGDIAEIKDGRIILKGRSQEMLRRQGYSVSPRDIEWALKNNRRIIECAAIGFSRDGQDDELVYFISGNISDDSLDSYIKANLPSVWRPDRIIRVDNLPRTPMGKVSLAKLRQMI